MRSERRVQENLHHDQAAGQFPGRDFPLRDCAAAQVRLRPADRYAGGTIVRNVSRRRAPDLEGFASDAVGMGCQAHSSAKTRPTAWTARRSSWASFRWCVPLKAQRTVCWRSSHTASCGSPWPNHVTAQAVPRRAHRVVPGLHGPVHPRDGKCCRR